MGKKEVRNKYGVQVGDIFVQERCTEDHGYHSFYQVVSLRGETQVAVRRICQKDIAFDGNYDEGVAPLPNKWASDEILIRKVQEGSKDDRYSACIRIDSGWCYSHAYLEKKKEVYWHFDGGPGYSYRLRTYHPEIAEQLRSENGSGVFAVDRPFRNYDDDCRVEIRYPDGRKQEAILKDLMHGSEEKQNL